MNDIVNKPTAVHPAVLELTRILQEQDKTIERKDDEVLKLKMEIESLRKQLESMQGNSTGEVKLNNEKKIGDEKHIDHEGFANAETIILNEEIPDNEKKVAGASLTNDEIYIDGEEIPSVIRKKWKKFAAYKLGRVLLIIPIFLYIINRKKQ